MREPVGYSVERWEHAASHDVAQQMRLLGEGFVALRQASQAWRAQLHDSSQLFQGVRAEPPTAEGFDFLTASALSAALLVGCVTILIMMIAHTLPGRKDVAHKLPGRKDLAASKRWPVVHPSTGAHIDYVQSTPSTDNVMPDKVEVLSKVTAPLPLKNAESRSFSRSRSLSRTLPTIFECVVPEGPSMTVLVARLCVEIRRSASANDAADEPLMRTAQISSEDEGQAEHERSRSPHTGPTHTGPTHTGPVAHTAALEPSELSRMSGLMGSHTTAEPQKPAAITQADLQQRARTLVLEPQCTWLGCVCQLAGNKCTVHVHL